MTIFSSNSDRAADRVLQILLAVVARFAISLPSLGQGGEDSPKKRTQGEEQMLKRSFAITMAVGALAIGGGATSALADGGSGTTTGTTAAPVTSTTDTTLPALVVAPPVQSGDMADEQGAANDVAQAAVEVQTEAVDQADDDVAGDQQNASDDSEESGDNGHGGNSGQGDSGQSVSTQDNSGSGSQSGDE
jgi:hypothetical protein